MIKTETINHYYCDKCGSEFTPTIECDGTRIFYGDEIGDDGDECFLQFGITQKAEPMMLCRDCQRKALDKAIRVLCDIYGRERNAKRDELFRRLQEVNPDVLEYCTSGEDDTIDMVRIFNSDYSFVMIPIRYPMNGIFDDDIINEIVAEYRQCLDSKNNGGEDK